VLTASNTFASSQAQKTSSQQQPLLLPQLQNSTIMKFPSIALAALLITAAAVQDTYFSSLERMKDIFPGDEPSRQDLLFGGRSCL
jgi:hypothetical protein